MLTFIIYIDNQKRIEQRSTGLNIEGQMENDGDQGRSAHIFVCAHKTVLIWMSACALHNVRTLGNLNF